jgi:hypothetical protein
MSALLRFFGVEALIEALLDRFNLGYLIRAIRAFLERLADERVDNRSLHDLVVAAASRAEILHPEGKGWEKYRMVFEAAVAAGHAWVREEAHDVAKTFGAWIDNEIQLAHAEITALARNHGTAILGSISARLDAYPEAAATLIRIGGTF